MSLDQGIPNHSLILGYVPSTLGGEEQESVTVWKEEADSIVILASLPKGQTFVF
jgi:hypothetical protein